LNLVYLLQPFDNMEHCDGEERLAGMLYAFPAPCTRLGAQGLACLALSNKSAFKTVEDIVCCDGMALLDAALGTARDSGQQQHIEAVGWLSAQLLQKAPTAAAEVTSRLLKQPTVRLDVARRLVAAGMRISYAQLLAAANSQVQGVEVWVQAQQQLRIQSDIPAAAVTICCSNHWVSVAW
jgi:hypothetical protein